MIPKILHHIWIGDKPFPEEYQAYLSKWKRLYPDYEFMFWDDNLIQQFNISDGPINRYYLNKNIKIALKADLLRFKILEIFGGIYVDTDTEPLKRMPNEFLEFDFFSGYQLNKSIAIGLMGSIKNEPMIIQYNNNIILNIEKFTINGIVGNQLQLITGPIYFTNFLQPYLNNPKYKFFDKKYFYPYTWMEPHRKKENFNITSPESYSVHHWAHSWKS